MANFSVDSLSSYDKILGSLSAYNTSGRVREDLDFSDFSNFVWFGSARFEVDNAVLEIQENYPNFTKWDIRSDNLVVTADDSIVSHYLGWKLAADPFVEYFVNDIVLYTATATVTGATYAKGDAGTYTFTFPWFDTTNKNVSPFTSGQQSQIEGWEQDADDFDESNFKSILKTIPDVVTEKDEDLKTLLSAIGHFFDNMLLQSQKTLDVYNLSYKFDQMPDAKTLDAFIDSIGMGRFYQFTEKNLLEYYESIYNTELTYSKKQFAKLMKIIFINNITKVIKSKGTKEAVKFAENIFGWPDNLVTVEEYIHVSDRLPSSGIQFDIPNIELRSFLLNSSTSQYHDFTASNISLNHSMTSNESGENGLVFSFKLNDVNDLRTGSGYWQDNTKQLFELKSVNDGYVYSDFDTNLVESSHFDDIGGPQTIGNYKASEYALSAYEQTPFSSSGIVRTLSAYIDATDIPCTSCGMTDNDVFDISGIYSNNKPYRISTYFKRNESDILLYLGFRKPYIPNDGSDPSVTSLTYLKHGGATGEQWYDWCYALNAQTSEVGANLSANRWFLFTGYIFPPGHILTSPISSAIYDVETGEKIVLDQLRDYAISSNISVTAFSTGLTAIRYMNSTEANPALISGAHTVKSYDVAVEVVDGTERTLEQLLAGPQIEKTFTFSASGASSGFVLSIDDEGYPASAGEIITKFPLTDPKWSNVSKATTFNVLLNPTTASDNNLALFGTYYPGTSPEKVNVDPGSVSSYTLGSFVYDTSILYSKSIWDETRQTDRNGISSDEFDPTIQFDITQGSPQFLFNNWKFYEVPSTLEYNPFSYSQTNTPYGVGKSVNEWAVNILASKDSEIIPINGFACRLHFPVSIDSASSYRISAFVKKNTDNHQLGYYQGIVDNNSYVRYNGSSIDSTLGNNEYNNLSVNFNETGLTSQKWYLITGYFFKNGYNFGGHTDGVSSSIYDVETGERIVISDTYDFALTGITSSIEVMLFPYWGSGMGAIDEDEEFTLFHPRVDVLDGSEPTIEELLDFSFTYSSEISRWNQFKFMQDSITGLSPLAFKLYNESLWTGNSNTEILSGVSSHLLDWEHIWKSNEKSSDPNKTPKSWYKFAQAASSIPDSVTYRSAWDPISLTALSGSEKAQTVKKPVFGSKKVTYNSGNVVDEIGIYPDTSEMDYVRSSNRLKIAISPVNAINTLITRILAINNFENLYGKPEDLYNDRYTYLTELKQYVSNILAQYDTGWYGGTFTQFFDVLQRGYSENIVNFIIENLIPAKSQTIAGLFIENDKLYDRKYKWTKPQIEDVVLEDDYKVNREQHAEDLSWETEIVQLHNYEVEDNYSETSVKHNIDEYAENLYSFTSFNKDTEATSEDLVKSCEFFNITQQLSEDHFYGEDEIRWQPIVSLTSEREYEWIYWYSPLQIWEPYVDYQGKETNVVSLTGSSLYGKSKWKDPSKSTQSTSGWRMDLAHLDSSKLVYNANKKNLYEEDDFGKLHVNLLRYGFSSPNTYVKVFVPSRDVDDVTPIISLSGLQSDDVYTTPVSSCKEYSIKLGENGRTVSYYLNLDSSNTAVTQATTELDFGSKSSTQIIVPVEATLLNKGSAGNGMIIEIVLDKELQSTYAKCEVKDERQLIISVCEAPYIIWNLIPAIEENSKAQSLFQFDFTDLQAIEDGGASEDDYRSNTFGKFYLKNGSDEMLNIKNRDYKIELINVYNNEKQSFSITPRSKTTQIDGKKDLEEQSPNW